MKIFEYDVETWIQPFLSVNYHHNTFLKSTCSVRNAVIRRVALLHERARVEELACTPEANIIYIVLQTRALVYISCVYFDSKIKNRLTNPLT